MEAGPKEWIDKAKRDLEVARYNFKGNLLEVAAFYSQQAAEKALKAVPGFISVAKEVLEWAEGYLLRQG